ncbi:MAG: hypothetical protein AAF791_01755 [Bacteroidota bacterium]
MPLPWSRRAAHRPPPYIDTPAGILSAGGVHFRTTEAALEDYAGPLLAKEKLAAFIRRAEAWLEAPRTLAIVTLPLWLWVLPWPWALVAILATYVLAALALPAAASRVGASVACVLANPGVQAIWLLAALSALSFLEGGPAVWAGLAAFVVLRVGLAERLLGPLLETARAKLYPLPVADQVLRAFLVRGAIRHNVSLPGLDEIEASARRAWQRKA